MKLSILLMVFMSVFSIAAGLFLGAGNYKGFVGALIPGIITGLIISIHFLRDHDWLSAAIVVGFAVVGSIIMTSMPDTNQLKRFCREQTSLTIRCGSYKLGQDKDGN